MTKGFALRRTYNRRYHVASRTEGAAETIGPLNGGDEITGLTCGQFSMIDILEHMLNESDEPADVLVSTWTAGIYDVERAATLAKNGNIRSIRWLMDRTMFSKSPQYAGPMIECFGLDKFRDSSVHAKITLVGTAAKKMVCRSSMNLNKNLKTEQFDISVCDATYEFFLAWGDKLWAAAAPGAGTESVFKAVFDEFTNLRGEKRKLAYPAASEVGAGLRRATEVAKRYGVA